MKIIEYLDRWAEENKLKTDRDTNSITFSVTGENGIWTARAIDLEEFLYVITAYPVLVPEEERERAALELGRLNSRIRMGAFYLDPEDGQINFRLCQLLPAQDEGADVSQISDLLMLAMRATDQYFLRIMAVASAEQHKGDSQ